MGIGNIDVKKIMCHSNQTLTTKRKKGGEVDSTRVQENKPKEDRKDYRRKGDVGTAYKSALQ